MIAWATRFLDDVVPLDGGSHSAITQYRVDRGRLVADVDGVPCGLVDPEVLEGFVGDPTEPSAILLRHNGLGIELRIDRAHPVGSTDRAGVADVVLEAALTTIMDCEDSVAAVDADDKALAYRNWLGLMRGDLTEEVTKDGKTFTRSMTDDRTLQRTRRRAGHRRPVGL